jgi:hypothetical protein
MCQKHLNDTNSIGTDIELFLTQFFLIRISSQYEKEIEQIIHHRAKKSNDIELASFVEETFQSFRHLRLKDLKLMLGKFSETYLNEFNQKISVSNPDLMYMTIVSNRNLVAHGGMANMTFNDIITFHNGAKDMLKILSEVLNS